ncbi:dipicolinic acid synthetase subunit A [Carboxydothermus ferrireducens]|uniref:Dipicolinate synthase subunit A n=1 Tax=Carboxydothermus ferrireducens DSM 11255 TaxID=1119529 RepID=A0ABX2RB20_9THEO|nr:dipicolinic acid synthetase subunit A [Carboxydothermus ferrireducens]NYE57057.1 dipicolinate synthase subunit A [Carboxydothermus ferrireducens DSM 11255]
MKQVLLGINLTILGGDLRNVYLIDELEKLGAFIKVLGLPVARRSKVVLCHSLEEALKDTDVVVLPMPGVNHQGKLFAPLCEESYYLTPELKDSIKEEVLFVVGFANSYLKHLAADLGVELIEIAEMDHVAIYNSIPSAEGAIQMAMEMIPITIHGSNAFVIGFGRTGQTLARMLAGIGARVFVAARKPKDLARIYEQCYIPVTFKELEAKIVEADIVFNTVPALVLPANLLQKLKKDAVIIDLASNPGGVDFEAAKSLGIQAVLAPGLPGKVAPKTAGKLLAKVLPELILKHCKARDWRDLG